MKKKISVLLGILLICLQTVSLHAQTFVLLHTFSTNSEGQLPDGLTLSGGILYGTTDQGDNGSGSESGTIYSVCPNGSNYWILYSFSGPDGANPTTVPVVSGGMIYGTTLAGGSNFDGVIYSVCTNGSNFTVLHTFDDGTNGRNPVGDLLLSGGTLFGTAGNTGGNYGVSTIFSVDTNGGSFTLIYSFTNNLDGAQACPGPLVLLGNTLYGMTQQGGSNNLGVIYSVCTNGSNFTVLHHFDPAQGGVPMGSLVLAGNTLFGTTELGGTNGHGTVFAIGSDGSNYRQIYAFGAIHDGAVPMCTLTLSGNTLYGTTDEGGSNGTGTVFEIETNGTGYQILHNFTSDNNGPITITNADGYDPQGTLVVSGTNVFGVPSQGGVTGWGVLFNLTLPPPPPSTPPFFTGEIALNVPGWYWLGPQGSDTYGFGYYSAEYAPYIMHQDLGWEYYLDANNANHGAYFYDFTDGVWFYTEPGVFPYLYDFNQNAWMYFAPQDGATDRYQSGPRWFYNTSTTAWGNDL